MKSTLLLAVLLFTSIVSFSQKTIYPEGLKVGDKAPFFEGVDNEGKLFSLKDQLKSGDVVVIFYRGQWCPYCKKELSEK